MRRIDSRAVWAALLFSLSLAACGGSDSDGSSASPSARSQQTGQQTGQQNSEQNSPQSGQQMAGADANANPGAEDKPPGAPEMHWAPGSGTSSAH